MSSSSGPGHAAIRQTESGCLALADISGYTSYLAGAEPDHAQDVLEDLTDTLVRSLSSRSASRTSFEDTPEGTRVTEYSAPAPEFGQQLFFSTTMRMMAGPMQQAVEALRSALRNAVAPQP